MHLQVEHAGSPRDVSVVLVARPTVTEGEAITDLLGAPAPDFELDHYLGPRPVLDRLAAWQRAYGDRGLRVVTVATGPSAADAASLAALPFPVADDPAAATAIAYGATELPTLIVIGDDGAVHAVASGDDLDLDGVQRLIERLLPP